MNRLNKLLANKAASQRKQAAAERAATIQLNPIAKPPMARAWALKPKWSNKR